MVLLQCNDDLVLPVQLPTQIYMDQGLRMAWNMLKPTGVPPAAWIKEEWVEHHDYLEWVTKAAAPCVVLGETLRR